MPCGGGGVGGRRRWRWLPLRGDRIRGHLGAQGLDEGGPGGAVVVGAIAVGAVALAGARGGGRDSDATGVRGLSAGAVAVGPGVGCRARLGHRRPAVVRGERQESSRLAGLARIWDDSIMCAMPDTKTSRSARLADQFEAAQESFIRLVPAPTLAPLAMGGQNTPGLRLTN